LTTKTVVLSDGTYATESVYTAAAAAPKTVAPASLRTVLLAGDFFVSTSLSAALVKLVMRYAALSSDVSRVNTLKAEAMLIMSSIIRLGQTLPEGAAGAAAAGGAASTALAVPPMESDDLNRVMLSLRSLADLGHAQEWAGLFLNERFPVPSSSTASPGSSTAGSKLQVQSQPDDLLAFRFLSAGAGAASMLTGTGAAAAEMDADLNLATGLKVPNKIESKLSKIMQLTGYSDAVYAEAYVNVHQFDIHLDIMIVNQTADTLQNLVVEFSTLGDLKVVERPPPHTMAPHSFHSVRISIKVSSTENGMIFGNIAYDGKASAPSDVNCVILNEIPLEILDYLRPGATTELGFRTMWSEFEWENKVVISNKPG
jgi:coatomer subunit beta